MIIARLIVDGNELPLENHASTPFPGTQADIFERTESLVN